MQDLYHQPYHYYCYHDCYDYSCHYYYEMAGRTPEGHDFSADNGLRVSGIRGLGFRGLGFRVGRLLFHRRVLGGFHHSSGL